MHPPNVSEEKSSDCVDSFNSTQIAPPLPLEQVQFVKTLLEREGSNSIEGESSSTDPFPELRVMDVKFVTFNTTEAEVKERRGDAFSRMEEKRVLLHVRDPVDLSLMIEDERGYLEEEEIVMLLRVDEPV